MLNESAAKHVGRVGLGDFSFPIIIRSVYQCALLVMTQIGSLVVMMILHL